MAHSRIDEPKPREIARVQGAIHGFVVAVATCCALSCLPSASCENSTPVEVPSPDGALGAWVFLRGCGATTADSVHVSILPTGSAPPSEGGNTFIVEERGSVSVNWPAERELLISYEPLGEVFKQEREVSGVRISYRRE